MLRPKQPDNYIVSLNKSNEKDLPDATKYCYNILKSKYGFKAKISDFVQMLESEYDHKFENFDKFTWNSPIFMSELIELQQNFNKGMNIDLSQLHTKILNEFSFTRDEKRMFLELIVEERLWAIFLILSNPAHEEYKLF